MTLNMYTVTELDVNRVVLCYCRSVIWTLDTSSTMPLVFLASWILCLWLRSWSQGQCRAVIIVWSLM